MKGSLSADKVFLHNMQESAESALNPPIKAPALLRTPSSHQPLCDHQSLFSPVHHT